MAQLYTLEAPDHPHVGGALIVYPSGYRQQITWRCPPVQAAMADPQRSGQELASAALQGLLDRGLRDDADRTNWASMAAGLAAVYRGWGERGRARESQGVYPGAGASTPQAT